MKFIPTSVLRTLNLTNTLLANIKCVKKIEYLAGIHLTKSKLNPK